MKGGAALKKLQQLAPAYGLEVIDRGYGHYQIKGGQCLVNWYPLSRKRTMYVAGTTQGIEYAVPEQVIKAARGLGWTFTPRKNKKRKGTKILRGQFQEGKTRCYLCGELMSQDKYILAKEPWRKVTVDHVVPLAKGGLDNPNNMALACLGCNNAKGSQLNSF